MRIGLVNEYFPPFAPGGAEWSTRYLAQRLTQSEYVVVITPNYGAAPREEMEGFFVERFPFPLRIRYGQRLLPRAFLANPVFYLYSAWQMARLIRKHGLGILHVQNKHSIVGAVLAAWITHRPVVVSVRDLSILCRFGMCLNDFDAHPEGCDLQSYVRCIRDFVALYMPQATLLHRTRVYAMAAYHRLDCLIKQAMLRRASAVIFPSEKMRTIYISRGLGASRSVTIYNPLPEDVSAPAPGQRAEGMYHMLYAGKLSWGKGAHLVLEALPAIREALSPAEVRLTLVGQGPLREYLAERAYTLGLANYVDFTGQIPHQQLLQLYSQVDVVIVPSIVQEAFGRVALEALESGTPVVASSHGGLPEIIEDGVTGVVVEPDPPEIAKGVLRVLLDAGFRRRVVEAWPRLATKFGTDVAEQHLALYRRVLHKEGSGRGQAR